METPGFSDKKSRGYIRTRHPKLRKRHEKLTQEQREEIAEFGRKVRKDVIRRRERKGKRNGF